MTTKIAYVLNGPNLNLLGTREPAVYGAATLADVEQLCVAASEQHSLGLVFRQSNHEGDLVDWIHEAGRLHAQGQLAGLIINAGAYTHTSVALQDASKALASPALSCTSATCLRARPFAITATFRRWPRRSCVALVSRATHWRWQHWPKCQSDICTFSCLFA